MEELARPVAALATPAWLVVERDGAPVGDAHATAHKTRPASSALHAALGLTSCGVLPRVGWKAGRWHDVALLQRPLGDAPYDGAAPPEPC